jgi:hypothetical protein
MFFLLERSVQPPTNFPVKSGRHDIAEILLKVALKHQKSNVDMNYCDLK